MRKLKPARLNQLAIEEGFWHHIQKNVREKVIPYQWEALNDRIEGAEPSGCVSNFEIAAGRKRGEFHGYVFQDSDLGKWIEAVAYSLASHPDAQQEKAADDVIDLIGGAQQADGYLNTYFTIKEPAMRWKNLRDLHELYCAGHMMEAAVAYYDATGKRKLLDIMLRVAEHIMTVLGPEEGKLRGYPGHPEIELALIKMYHATGDERLLKLASFFVDERGKKPNFFETEHLEKPLNPEYNQSHLPVREQTTLEGHSVRALYLLSGMADVAAETGDRPLLSACRTLFDNVVNKRMYVTGGVGSTFHGEAFTFDYDLPNDTVYAETCASIALVFFAHRMLQISPDAAYANAMERALYNTCIAGMSLDGSKFFYVNPLEVQPEASRKDPGKKHVLPDRPHWFGCACCPPNLARLVASLGQYAYSTDEEGVFVHLFIDSKAVFDKCTLVQKTAYPFDGLVAFTLSAGDYALRVRVPDWCAAYTVAINGKETSPSIENGYLVIKRNWSEGDAVEFKMEMPVQRVYANPCVKEDIGKVCVTRGPLVYCAEEADNGKHLHALRLSPNAPLCARFEEDVLGGVVVIRGEAETCTDDGQALYRTQRPQFDRKIPLTLIPYYAWNNRGEGEMAVWLHEGQ